MTRAGAKPLLHTCFATAALLLFAAAGSRAETLDQLYEKAKLDKALVFYSGDPAAPHENRAKEFMQKYPGIAVSVTAMHGTRLADPLRASNLEVRPAISNRSPAKIMLGTTAASWIFSPGMACSDQTKRLPQT
jgi:ABC-type glycerol-3-phosphate transport system substrate-binding protein